MSMSYQIRLRQYWPTTHQLKEIYKVNNELGKTIKDLDLWDTEYALEIRGIGYNDLHTCDKYKYKCEFRIIVN